MATTGPDGPEADPTLVRDIEEASLASWPALETIVDGSWRIRVATGQTGRANSVTFLDRDDGGNAERRIAAAEAVYRAHGLPPMFRITPLTPKTVLQACDRLGYRSCDPTRTLWHPGLPAAPISDGIETVVAPIPTCEWLDAVSAFSEFSEAKRSGMKQKLARLAIPAAFIVLRIDGLAVATVMATVHGGRLGVLDLAVSPDKRRRGLARAAIGEAIRWGGTHGAGEIWLQVVAGNAPAEALYRTLEFEEIYPYGYRTPDEAAR